MIPSSWTWVISSLDRGTLLSHTTAILTPQSATWWYLVAMFTHMLQNALVIGSMLLIWKFLHLVRDCVCTYYNNTSMWLHVPHLYIASSMNKSIILLVHTGVPSLQNLCISTIIAEKKLLTSSHPTIPPPLWQHVSDMHNAQQKHSLIKPKHVHK